MILAVSKRWHLWRHRAARWVVRRVLDPLARRLMAFAHVEGVLANEQHDKARLRYEACLRCPARNPANDRCRAMTCNCPMTRKVQQTSATCPQGRW